MQLPKIDPQRLMLSQLLTPMGSGELQVPRFQRNFVWELPKTRTLLDSMYKEFPIGTFFLWRAPAGTPPLSRPLTELGIPASPPGAPVTYILDGQQRLTSLYVTTRGLVVDARDYSHICVDLETATKYETNTDDGFEEDIFVYHVGDNQRYVPVCELVGPNDLVIFDQIPQPWKPVFTKARNLFSTYPFSIVWIQEQRLFDAIVIFQRINQEGKPLSRYDLVCANVWTETLDFRRRVADLNKKYDQQGFGALDETIFTQTFALALKDQCTTAAELSLTSKEIQDAWGNVVKSLGLAIEFVVSNLGVKRADLLPYRGILVVLADYFYHAEHSAISARERKALWNWFWRVTLSERYSSTSPSKMADDAKKLRTLREGQEAIFNYPATVTPEAVARTRMTSTASALRNAVLCMLALRHPLNLKDSSPVNLFDTFFSNLKKAERHHIFPGGYLKTKGIQPTRVHALPNFCFIPADLNQEIGSQPPAEYLAKYKTSNRGGFAAAASSHLIPVETGAAVWANDFERFLAERAQLIAEELGKLVEKGPDDHAEHQLHDVDVLELRLRDFIDHRLTAMMGAHYWKQAMPGDVVTSVKELIETWQKKHPYEEEPRAGRARLDFCDVSHYEKIFLKNWEQFGEIFKDKGELQKHMSAYRNLRHPVQHNRPSTDVEQKNGEAAVIWLNRVLDKYYALLEESNAEDGGDQALETATGK